MNVSLSILIPIYSRYDGLNEQVHRLSDYLSSQFLQHEILLIDNTDTSILPDIVREDGHIKIVRPPSRSSQQRSYFEGFQVSKGDWAFLLDHDVIERNDLIDAMVAHLGGDYAVIRAIRQNRRHQNILRLLGSRVANFVFNLGSANKIRDIGSSLSLYRKEYYKSALEKEYQRFYDFPLFLLTLRPLRIKEVPVDVSGEPTASEYSLWKLTCVFLSMLRLKLRVLSEGLKLF